jgi:hypothetical protein
MSFEDRLQKAIQRGKRRSHAQEQEKAARAMSQEELKRLHSSYRLQLSEQIEKCVKQLPNYFPGFRFETIYGDRGWGGACSRDDLRVSGQRRRENTYSRLEITVRPYSPNVDVIELVGKGTIRNKEVFNRNFFDRIEEADPEKFAELVNVWVLEYAELFAAKNE